MKLLSLSQFYSGVRRFRVSSVNTFPKRLSAAAIIALAIVIPVASFAAETVTIEGTMGVANVTAGNTQYKKTVNASNDQVVKYQVYYHNREASISNKIAQNLNVKINLPTTAGKTQQATATIKADNSNAVTDSTTVNLDRADAYLQYIPGSVVWRHNISTNNAPKYVETKLSDAVVTSSQGATLENAKPCCNSTATVTVLARVRLPVVQVLKQVRVDAAGTTYSTANTANPGDTLQYRIVYTNIGDTTHRNVVIRDELPKNVALVPKSTYIFNQTYPNGTPVGTDGITAGGIDIGSYGPGANAYVAFKTKLPVATKLACGENVIKNIGFVVPKGMNNYYGSATTTVTKTCAAATSKAPVYSCDSFDFTQGENRTISISKFDKTATNGATFKNAVITWDDNTASLTTDAPVGKTHKFAKDGTYTVAVTAHFIVNGKDVTAPSEKCSKAVTFTAAPAAPTPPATTTPQPQGEAIPNTGPGSVIGLFGAATLLGVFAHRMFLARRLKNL